MTNRLAAHPTRWRWWYALLAVPAFVVGSTVVMVAEPAGDGTVPPLAAILPALSFVAFAGVALALIAVVARRWPSARDLGLTRRLGGRDLALIVAVFVVTHVLFWLLTRNTGSAADSARALFRDMRLDAGLFPAFMALFTAVILAPVCEEILYRAAVLRPIHDHLARRGRATLGAVLGIAVSSVLFAMPHLGDGASAPVMASYLLTGVAFGLVYVLTGSLTAAMVSHSLQSAFAFGQVLLFGAGDATVSPVLYVLVFGCPLWVYLVARGLRAVLPERA